MSKAIFRNVVLAYGDIRYSPDLGPVMRLHFSADYSDSLVDEMNCKGGKKGEERQGGLGWITLPMSMPSCKLSGKLIGCENMILTPNGQLAANQIQFPVIEVSDFAVKRIKSGEDSTEDKLTFIVRSMDPTASGIVWDFLKMCGKVDCQLSISYAKQLTTEEDTDEAESEDPDEVIFDQESLSFSEKVADEETVTSPKRRGRPSQKQQLADAAATGSEEAHQVPEFAAEVLD